MARSIKKGPFVDQYLIDKVEKMGKNKTAIKTWSRRSMIIPDFVGTNSASVLPPGISVNTAPFPVRTNNFCRNGARRPFPPPPAKKTRFRALRGGVFFLVRLPDFFRGE